MGCMPRFGVSANSTDYEPNEITTPNPNKYNFKILDVLSKIGDLVLLRVHYPDCTTFDGVKIIIIECDYFDVNMDILDPHFLDDNNVLARFRPSARGLSMAYESMRLELKSKGFWDSVNAVRRVKL